MDDNSLTRGIKHILCGHFRRAKSVFTARSSKKYDIVDDFIRKNNRYICDVIQDMQELGRIKLTRVEELRDLVNRVIGLSVNEHTIYIELAVSYNYALCLLITQHHQFTAEDCLEQHIHSSLLRVKKLCVRRNTEDLETFSVLQSDDITRIVQWLAGHNPECVQICLGLFGILALHWMLQGNMDHSMQMISRVQRSMNNLDGSFKPHQNGDTLGVMVLINGNQTITLTSGNQSSQDNCLFDVLKLVQLWNHYSQGDKSGCQEMSANFPKNSKHIALWLTATYMQAYLQYQDGHFQGPTYILQNILETTASVGATPQYSSMVKTLLGCCLAKQSKHQTSIHHFSKALQDNFDNLSAMYNIAIQYKQLRWYDAELETWNLLITTLENMKTHNARDRKQELVMILDDRSLCGDYYSVKLSKSTGQLKRATLLYIMARRCLDLERYDIASQRYLDLMAFIMDSAVMQIHPELKGEANLPDITTIYSETVSALLLSEKDSDAVIVADQVLSKVTYRDDNKLNVISQIDGSDSELLVQSTPDETLPPHVDDGVTQDCDGSLSLSQSSRKRFRSDDAATPGEEEARLANVASVLMMQAEAFVKMEEVDNALRCLDDVCQILSDVTGEDEDAQTTDSKDHKRRRLNTDGDKVTELTNRNSVPHLLCIKSMAYNNKAMILVSCGKQQEALKILLLSIQCNKDNQDAVYNHTLLLLQLGRLQQAVTNWLHFRQIDTKMDSMQIGHLLKKKETFLRSEEAKYLPDMESQCLRLDQVIIQQWQKLISKRSSVL